MSNSNPIWNSLDELFEKCTWTRWLSPLQQVTGEEVRFDDLARSCKTLSHLYRTQSSAASQAKALGYGLLTAICYLRMNRIAPAMAQCDWMKGISDSRGIVEYLESEISRTVCNAPTHAVAGSEPPQAIKDLDSSETNIQDPRAIQAIRESFKTERTLDYPKATYPFFSELPMEEVSALIKKAQVRHLEAQEVLFHEGDAPTSFFLVAEGSIRLHSSKGFNKTFEEGEFFGELGVIGSMNRTATATAQDRCVVIEFSKELLVDTFIQFPEMEKKILRHFYLRLFLNKVQDHEIFKGLSPKEHLEFFYTFTPGLLKSTRDLFRQGDASESFYYLLSGEWEVIRQDGTRILQGPGSFVGERGFLNKKPRNATVTAKSDCHYLRCEQTMFRSFGNSFPRIEELLKKLADERLDPAQTDPAKFIA